jgi:hypothetical protein|tara:strand:- start:2 stop:337 length:336 start_codon:yes stop_codon:yes gene_type:complete
MILEKILQAFKNKDSTAFLELMHDEVVFVDDYSIETKEDSGISVKEWFDDGAIDVSSWDILVQQELPDIVTLQFLRPPIYDEQGESIRVTYALLLKDGKIWRHAVTRTRIK